MYIFHIRIKLRLQIKCKYAKIADVDRGVAQLGARLVRDQEVAGSNPVTPTNWSGHIHVTTP